MNTLLTENHSQYLMDLSIEPIRLQEYFAIVNGTGAKFGVDGDQYYYGFGEIQDKASVWGFGKTPRAALTAFCNAYYSQTVKSAK